MTTISTVSIANGALTLLGDKLITDLTENTEQGRAVNARYEHVRDAVTRAHPWKSALSLANIATNATTPEWGFTNEFNLPTDPYCLRVLEIEDLEMEQWEVQGRKVFCDNSSINMRYIKRLLDPMQMDALLIDAISARLAHDVAYRLTGSRAMRGDMWRHYQEVLKEARSINGQEGLPPTISSDIFTEARL